MKQQGELFGKEYARDRGFAIETRSLRARDGTYRWHLQQAVVLRDAKGKVLKFVGTTTDIDDQKRAEEALRQAQGDLARINRVTTMGELAASLAHEIMSTDQWCYHQRQRLPAKARAR